MRRKQVRNKRHQTRARLFLLELLSQFLLQPDPVQRPPIASSTSLTRTEPSVIPAARNEPIGLKASDFLPVSVSGQCFLPNVCVGSKRGCPIVIGMNTAELSLAYEEPVIKAESKG